MADYAQNLKAYFKQNGIFIAFLLVVLAVGFGFGFLIRGVTAETDGIQIAPGIAPSVTITATPDPAGWNLTLTTTNFIFTPDSVGKDDVFGEGHAHLYIDGVEGRTRIYSDRYHLSKTLATAGAQVYATLSRNDHQEYQVDGQTIQSPQITLPPLP